MIDGAMGSWGAWLSEPYRDRPRDSAGKPYRGLPVQSPEFIREVSRAALEHGWQVCTHAIGDRGIRETLDAYQAALGERPAADHRFRIEHAQNPALADIPRFAKLGVIPSMQQSHVMSDMRWAEARVGPERVKGAYAWRKFLKAGCRIAGGSDFPVESENPLRGIYAAVTRQDDGGNPPGGWRPEEAMTREEALRSFTIDAAYASFEEEKRGSLEPGKLADFVVWSRDIVACPPLELLTAAPVQVVIGGTVARESGAEAAWTAAMRETHSRFKGKRGTFAQFGDSITVTMAYWSPLAETRKNAPPEMEEAFRRVKAYLQPECWRDWKGPRFGSDGGQTARWALENVDRWLRDLNPEVALIMFGTNDLHAVWLEEYREKLRKVVERCLANGTVVILSTIPPRSGMAEKAAEYSDAVRAIARELKVPLTDYHAEILKRRPADWDGSGAAFKAFQGYDVPTLISRDGVHPSYPRQYQGDYSEEALRSSGYSLRSYLTLIKYDEVIRSLGAPGPAEQPSGGGGGGAPPGEKSAAATADDRWLPRAPGLPPPDARAVRVSGVEALFAAVEGAAPGATVLLADGRYDLPRRLDLKTDRLTLRGASGRRERVVLDGKAHGLGELVSISRSSGVIIADLSIANARWNGFKINSEQGVQDLTIYNCEIHNVWQRGVKGVAVPPKDRDSVRPSRFRVQYCYFHNDRAKEFADDPADRPDNFNGDYLGGLDVMFAKDWTVSDNVFEGLRGRTGQGRGAIFFWHESEGCVIERNVIIDCDSGICLGNSHLPGDLELHARRCVVRNNFITRAPEQGILADYTADSQIVHNTIHDPQNRLGRLIRLVHRNDGLLVANNLLSGPEVRNESQSRIRLERNVARDLTDFLAAPARGDLHLASPVPDAVDRALVLSGVAEDFDRSPRGEKPDIGAHEFGRHPIGN
jgi:hypothetical protein